MGKEYIEREAAYESLLNGMVMTGYQSRALDCISEFSIPAADVVPVVRCKECKYWKKYDNTAGCGYCHAVKFEYGADGYAFHPVREPGFFCADGARMDGDEE